METQQASGRQARKGPLVIMIVMGFLLLQRPLEGKAHLRHLEPALIAQTGTHRLLIQLLRTVVQKPSPSPQPEKTALLPLRATETRRPPTHGQKQVWSWMEKSWAQPWNGCTPFTATSCRHGAYRLDPRQGAWEDSGDGPMEQTGYRCKARRGRDSRGTVCESGRSTSTRRRMNGADGGDRDPPDVTNEHRTPYRPRSLRAVRFQQPCHLHPYAFPKTPKYRNKHRCLLPSSQPSRPAEAKVRPGHHRPLTSSGLDPILPWVQTKLDSRVDGQRKYSTQVGLSGPKSGGCRTTRPLRALIIATAGARVSSAAAVTEDGPRHRLGKHHGTAQQGRELPNPTRHMKRAFNRACKRAK